LNRLLPTNRYTNPRRRFFEVGFLILLLVSVFPASPAGAESPLSLVIENQTYVYNQERAKEVDLSLQTEGFTLIGNLSKAFFQYKIPGQQIFFQSYVAKKEASSSSFLFVFYLFFYFFLFVPDSVFKIFKINYILE